MKNKSENFSPEENFKLENESVTDVSDDLTFAKNLEKEWFDYIFDHEKLLKETIYTTVYDFIGKPACKKLEELSPHKVKETLHRLLENMYAKGIDFCFENDCYSWQVLYQFITEELFKEKISYTGPRCKARMIFCYEEFYPNHKLDIRRSTTQYLEELFIQKTWNYNFLKFTHDDRIQLNGTSLSLQEYSDRIIHFQKYYASDLFSNPIMMDLHFDLETKTAYVKGTIVMSGKAMPYSIYFNYSFDMWVISGVEIATI